MGFTVKFNGEEKHYNKAVSILDVVGDNRDYVCARINNRVRELTYMLDSDCVVEPLTCKDRDSIR